MTRILELNQCGIIKKFLQTRQPFVWISLVSLAASLGMKNVHSLQTSLSTAERRREYSLLMEGRPGTMSY